MATDGGATKRKAPDEDGSLLFYKANRDKQIIHVFRNYCDRKNLEYQTMRFLYNGQRVLGRQTSKKLNLENDAVILAVRPVTGGGVVALSFYRDDMAR